MKVLLVSHTTDSGNGWGRFTRDLARALRERGHTVTVLNEWALGKNRGTLHTPDQYLGYAVGWVRDRKLLQSAVDELMPDIVHVTVEPYASLISLVRIPTTTQVFLTIHGTFAYYPRLAPPILRSAHRVLYSRALARTASVLPVSNNTKRIYEGLITLAKLPAPRMQVIHNGVWMRDHMLPLLSREEKPGFTVLSVGAVKARKGILEVLKGIVELKKQHGVEATYRIVGALDNGDSYVQKLRAFVESEGIKSEVQFLGSLSGHELEEELRRAHVIALLPKSVGNSLEGFGLVYLEANAYGVPALGARHTVSEEAIKEGESGLLCNADDPLDVAGALTKIYNGAVAAAPARQWAVAHDWGVIVKEYEALYNKII